MQTIIKEVRAMMLDITQRQLILSPEKYAFDISGLQMEDEMQRIQFRVGKYRVYVYVKGPSLKMSIYDEKEPVLGGFAEVYCTEQMLMLNGAGKVRKEWYERFDSFIKMLFYDTEFSVLHKDEIRAAKTTEEMQALLNHAIQEEAAKAHGKVSFDTAQFLCREIMDVAIGGSNFESALWYFHLDSTPEGSWKATVKE